MRTAKYAGIRRSRSPVQYRRKSGWLPYIELAIGTYFLGMVAFAIDTANYLSIPFLMLFVCGYYWAGCATLYQEFQGKLRWKAQMAASRASSES